MSGSIDLTSEQRDTVETLLARHLPNTEAWAYGSRVRWTSRPQSDLDMVVFTTPDQERAVSDLREAFEESNLPFRVDLFVWDEVPDSFRKQIEREHVVLSRGNAAMKRAWLFHPVFPSHWQSCSLYLMATWVNGIAFRNIEFSETGWPVIKIAEIKAGISGQTKFTQKTFDKSVSVQPGDLLFSWSGQPETSIDSFWYRGPKGWLNQHIFKVNPIVEIDVKFFYYLLRYLKPSFVGIARNKQTTGLGHVTKRDLENMEVAYPDLAEQRAIAHILGTLDDKIELNRRMNATLEAMARALFKSWFVDFDPVRAKLEGRDTGLPKEVADLFPDRLVDSDLGEIPQGWTVLQLGDMIDLAYGKALKAKARNAAGRVPVFGSNGQIGWHDEALVDGPGIVVGRKGNPGLVTLSPTEFFPIDTTFYVVPKDESEGCLYFLFLALLEQDLPSLAADSAVPGLNRNLAYMNEQLKPAASVVKCFDRCTSALYARFRQAAAETHSLGLARDALLPELISGQVRIPATTRVVDRG